MGPLHQIVAEHIPRHLHKKEQKQILLEAIVKAHAGRIPLNIYSIQKNSENKWLYLASILLYGKKQFWRKAITEAKIDYSTILKYQKWTKTKVIQELKTLYRNGEDVRGIALRKTHPDLHSAGMKRFGNWSKTLENAGINPEKLKQTIRCQRNQPKIKTLSEEIKQAYAQGVDLRATLVQATPQYRPYYERAKTLFPGSDFWEQALTSAGIDYHTIVRQERWTKDKIIRVLQSRKKEHAPLNPGAIHKYNAGVEKAMNRLFGSFDDALKAAGITPEKARINNKSYSNEELIEQIISYDIKGTVLRQREILNGKDSKLRGIFFSASKKFHGWYNALATAGIDRNKYALRQRWSEEKIKTGLTELIEQNVPLNTKYVMDNHHPLYRAATRKFSSWENALSQFGINYADVKMFIDLSADQIISEIKRLNTEGQNLNAGALYDHESISIRRIFRQSISRFGSWDEALRKADLDPEKIRLTRKKYTDKDLAQKILELEKQGMCLSRKEIWNNKETRKYYEAVMHRHDSWETYLNSIGIDSSKYITMINWDSGKRIIKELQERYPAGVVTGASTKDRNISAAIGRYFSCMKQAVEAAGLIYSKSGKITKKMLDENPKAVGILYEKNKEYLTGLARSVYYFSRGKGIRTLELNDLISEAFMAFIELLPSKPCKEDIRSYVRKPIQRKLSAINRHHFKEVYFNEETYLDVFKEEGFSEEPEAANLAYEQFARQV